MKTIGMIGGMSWESTVTYYQIINTAVKQKLGGFHSAKCILHSVDFHEIEMCQTSGDWEKGAKILGETARGLEKAGADFILICTNTMHKVYPEIQACVGVPVLHIAELTARELKKNGITKVGLLGTKYTMEQDFYKSRLVEHDIGVLVPEPHDIDFVNNVIFNELCLGEIKPESKRRYLEIIDRLALHGAQGIILGCTEIGLLVGQDDTSVSLFDTTRIHAEMAAEQALRE